MLSLVLFLSFLYTKALLIFGLFLNLFGAFKVYKSIKPYPVYYAYSGDREAFPAATIDIVIAKTGLIYIIAGTLLQIISTISAMRTIN